MKKLFFSLLMISSLSGFAQNTKGAEPLVEMADQLREDGKIWIVVGVVLLVLLGLLIYVILLDRKISKIERDIHSIKD